MRISDWSSDVCSSDLDRPGKLNADRAIIGRVRARSQPDLAVRRIAPLPAGDPQPRRRQAEAGEADHTVGAIAHRARRGRIAAEEIANPRIEQSRRARRSEERRVGKKCGRTGKTRWWPDQLKKK